MSEEIYREAVQKMEAVEKARTDREEEVEQALSCSMPGLLRRLMSKHGAVRPALRDLNERLDEVGMDANVSPNTFYDWCRKYKILD